MRVGVVDIGTNSMRLLITDGDEDVMRLERVTGLGRGVDRTGVLSEEAVAVSLEALEDYGHLLDEAGVARRKAIATSASRDARNREQFFDAVEDVIGVRPTLIGGDEEARFAYAGATQHFPAPEPVLVSDIGGGSTEFVTAGEAVSIDIGSVRLTERALPDRPASPAQLKEAREHVAGLFAGLDFGPVATLIGVAGTWTEIPVLVRGPGAERDGAVLTSTEVTAVVERLAGLRVDETAAIPGFNPGRAPVILGGVVVAEAVLRTLGMSEVTISIRDTMDGVAATLLALP
jgi:exopolyphosphatase/guanosine-5'-triphosphate,3'-diphosphate pyrophosphatase